MKQAGVGEVHRSLHARPVVGSADRTQELAVRVDEHIERTNEVGTRGDRAFGETLEDAVVGELVITPEEADVVAAAMIERLVPRVVETAVLTGRPPRISALRRFRMSTVPSVTAALMPRKKVGASSVNLPRSVVTNRMFAGNPTGAA